MFDELLSNIPSAEDMPARIEALQLAADDVQERINDLAAEKCRVEEEATTQAAEESNADKRKVKKFELLRDDLDYADMLVNIRRQERVKLQLTERAARLRRELRLHYGKQLEASRF